MKKGAALVFLWSRGSCHWFGAMQAQDVASGLWSLGVRLPGVHADR